LRHRLVDKLLVDPASARVELANAIFEYLEIFHNRTRRHSALGMLTPIQFEHASTVA
jgi:transposase InsO family protein